MPVSLVWDLELTTKSAGNRCSMMSSPRSAVSAMPHLPLSHVKLTAQWCICHAAFTTVVSTMPHLPLCHVELTAQWCICHAAFARVTCWAHRTMVYLSGRICHCCICHAAFAMVYLRWAHRTVMTAMPHLPLSHDEFTAQWCNYHAAFTVIFFSCCAHETVMTTTPQCTTVSRDAGTSHADLCHAAIIITLSQVEHIAQ